MPHAHGIIGPHGRERHGAVGRVQADDVLARRAGLRQHAATLAQDRRLVQHLRVDGQVLEVARRVLVALVAEECERVRQLVLVGVGRRAFLARVAVEVEGDLSRGGAGEDESVVDARADRLLALEVGGLGEGLEVVVDVHASVSPTISADDTAPTRGDVQTSHDVDGVGLGGDAARLSDREALARPEPVAQDGVERAVAPVGLESGTFGAGEQRIRELVVELLVHARALTKQHASAHRHPPVPGLRIDADVGGLDGVVEDVGHLGGHVVVGLPRLAALDVLPLLAVRAHHDLVGRDPLRRVGAALSHDARHRHLLPEVDLHEVAHRGPSRAPRLRGVEAALAVPVAGAVVVVRGAVAQTQVRRHVEVRELARLAVLGQCAPALVLNLALGELAVPKLDLFDEARGVDGGVGPVEEPDALGVEGELVVVGRRARGALVPVEVETHGALLRPRDDKRVLDAGADDLVADQLGGSRERLELILDEEAAVAPPVRGHQDAVDHGVERGLEQDCVRRAADAARLLESEALARTEAVARAVIEGALAPGGVEPRSLGGREQAAVQEVVDEHVALARPLAEQHRRAHRHVAVPALRVDAHVLALDGVVEEDLHLGALVLVGFVRPAALHILESLTILRDQDLGGGDPLRVVAAAADDNAGDALDLAGVNLHPLSNLVDGCGPPLRRAQLPTTMAIAHRVPVPDAAEGHAEVGGVVGDGVVARLGGLRQRAPALRCHLLQRELAVPQLDLAQQAARVLRAVVVEEGDVRHFKRVAPGEERLAHSALATVQEELHVAAHAARDAELVVAPRVDALLALEARRHGEKLILLVDIQAIVIPVLGLEQPAPAVGGVEAGDDDDGVCHSLEAAAGIQIEAVAGVELVGAGVREEVAFAPQRLQRRAIAAGEERHEEGVAEVALDALPLADHHARAHRHVPVPGLRVDADIASPKRPVEPVLDFGVAIHVGIEQATAMNVLPAVAVHAHLDFIGGDPLVVVSAALGDDAHHAHHLTHVDLHPVPNLVGAGAPGLGAVQAAAAVARAHLVVVPHRRVGVANVGRGEDDVVLAGRVLDREVAVADQRHLLLAENLVPQRDALDQARGVLGAVVVEEHHVLRVEQEVLAHSGFARHADAAVEVERHIALAVARDTELVEPRGADLLIAVQPRSTREDLVQLVDVETVVAPALREEKAAPARDLVQLGIDDDGVLLALHAAVLVQLKTLARAESVRAKRGVEGALAPGGLEGGAVGARLILLAERVVQLALDAGQLAHDDRGAHGDGAAPCEGEDADQPRADRPGEEDTALGVAVVVAGEVAAAVDVDPGGAVVADLDLEAGDPLVGVAPALGHNAHDGADLAGVKLHPLAQSLSV
mmetsp:Transcript_52370/g.137012  ORF Transcript_52370/g.137012 Transcript_52370/m.137012 type:complete len:1358 (-) Transcript_52370:2313-6386(-)